MKTSTRRKAAFFAAVMILAAAWSMCSPVAELPPVPDPLSALLKSANDSPGFFGFGFLLDVPEELLTNDKGMPLRIELTQLKDFETGDYLNRCDDVPRYARKDHPSPSPHVQPRYILRRTRWVEFG